MTRKKVALHGIPIFDDFLQIFIQENVDVILHDIFINFNLHRKYAWIGCKHLGKNSF